MVIDRPWFYYYTIHTLPLSVWYEKTPSGLCKYESNTVTICCRYYNNNSNNNNNNMV